jgi:hypothetical protein
MLLFKLLQILIRATIAYALSRLTRVLKPLHSQNQIDHKVTDEGERPAPGNDREDEADVAP